MHTEQQLSSTTPFMGKIFHVNSDKVLVENGTEATREVARHHTGGACVICALNGRLAFVRQYRYAYAEELLEVPAGKLEPGEAPSVCAARELREETGLRAESLVDLGECYPSPGWVEERVHIYAARGVTKDAACPDADEFLDVVWIEPEEALRMVLCNEIKDAKTQIAVLKWTALREKENLL